MKTSPEQRQGHLIIDSCIDNVWNHETDEGQKERLSTIIKRFKVARDYGLLSAFTQPQYKMFKMLLETFTAYKKSFYQAVAKDKFRFIDEPRIDVCAFLAQIQKTIKLDRLNPSFNEIVDQYTVQLLKLAQKYCWTSQFLIFWTALAKSRVNITNKTVLEVKTQRTLQRASPIQALNSQNHKKPKTRINMPNQGRNQSKLRQKTIQTPKQKRSQINRFQAMEKYLEGRIDLPFNNNKHRNITQFIAMRLDHFMKITLNQIIDISTLKNRGGKDQLSYFGGKDQRINHYSPFNVSSSKIFTIAYKNKFKIYRQLREKQLNRQDDLRTALSSKLCQTDQSLSNIALSYLVKPRPTNSESNNICQQQGKHDYLKQDGIQIRAEHAICYLENHRYLRNSQLLFDSYHY